MQDESEDVVRSLQQNNFFVWIGNRKQSLRTLSAIEEDHLSCRCRDWMEDADIDGLPPLKPSLTNVSGLVVLQFHHADPGLLRRRSSEEQILRSLIGAPGDSYVCKILCKIGLKDLTSVNSMWVATSENRNMVQYDFIELMESCSQRLLDQEAVDGRPVRSSWQEWCNGFNSDVPIPTTLVLLPYPIGLLAAQAPWNVVALSWERKCHPRSPLKRVVASLHAARHLLFDPDAVDNCADADSCGQDSFVFGRSDFNELADHIRLLTEGLASDQQAISIEEVDLTKANSVHWIDWLTRLAASHSTEEFNRRAWERSISRGGHFSKKLGAHGHFDYGYLLQSLKD